MATATMHYEQDSISIILTVAIALLMVITATTIDTIVGNTVTFIIFIRTSSLSRVNQIK